ncbi:MAG: cyclic pyranopterin monophosphate synthase MoaC [Deferribacteraceae bacterium]|jgi:cyclic pyranopterin phosphate synthase|nr:cyclic pyranopterin monophosphate synthase MoaC [Deferribacteraceae bacterium]
MNSLTHIDSDGKLRMVDVTEKGDTLREAEARGVIGMQSSTLALILENRAKKGNVLEAARLAGIMAAKRTSDIIPLCHPLSLTSVEVEFSPDEEKSEIEITARARLTGKTGVEMEALTAVSAAALTIYDMVKAADKTMVISDIRLMKKSGGRSGAYIRAE